MIFVCDSSVAVCRKLRLLGARQPAAGVVDRGRWRAVGGARGGGLMEMSHKKAPHEAGLEAINSQGVRREQG